MRKFVIYRNAATLCAAFCLVPTLALAQSAAAPSRLFASIGEKPAILYDGLSTRANKVYILSRFHPVEVLVKLDKWTKIRAQGNTIGWLENASLGERRFILIASAQAEIRAAPNGRAAIVFEAQRAVILELTGAATAEGWLPVRHHDGEAGYVRVAQIWGA